MLIYITYLINNKIEGFNFTSAQERKVLIKFSNYFFIIIKPQEVIALIIRYWNFEKELKFYLYIHIDEDFKPRKNYLNYLSCPNVHYF